MEHGAVLRVHSAIVEQLGGLQCHFGVKSCIFGIIYHLSSENTLQNALKLYLVH